MKAQFTMEFMLLFSIAFLVFLVSLALVVRYVDSRNQDTEVAQLQRLGEGIKKDIILAYESGDGYSAQLQVPSDINTNPVTVQLDEDVDLLYVKSVNSQQTRIFNLPDVSGSMGPGCNTIVNTEGVIQIATC